MALKVFLTVVAFYLPQVYGSELNVASIVPIPVPGPLVPEPVPVPFIPRPVPGVPHPVIAVPVPIPIAVPIPVGALDSLGELLLMEQCLLEMRRFIDLSVASAFAAAQAALGAANANIEGVSNAIASGLNATTIAAAECSLTTNAGIQGVLEEFSDTISSCIETSMNQYRATLEALEAATANARSTLTSATVQLVTCIDSAYEPEQLTSCFQGTLPSSVADVAAAFSSVNFLLATVTAQTEVFPLQAELCTVDGAVTTQPAIVSLFNEIQLCLATVAPPHESDMNNRRLTVAQAA